MLFLQFGYPGEEWDDIERTIRMVRETRPDDIGVSVSYPLPGHAFPPDRRGAQIGAKANWGDSDDLAMMFQGAYSTEFYRALADALHRGGARRSELRPRSCATRWEKVRAASDGPAADPRLFPRRRPKEQQIMKPYPPLGILYLSSHLRSRGFDVEVYDSTFGSREELFGILGRGPPAMLGRRTANLMTRADALAIIERARRCGWRVMLGGPEPANYAEEYLAAGADVIVAGRRRARAGATAARRCASPIAA